MYYAEYTFLTWNLVTEIIRTNCDMFLEIDTLIIQNFIISYECVALVT